jgi:hypothetical protein
MTIKSFKKITLNISFIYFLASTFSAYAAGDGPTGAGLGSNIPANDKAGATDVFILSCPVGTLSARASINEGNNDGAPVSVQIINPHGSAVTENGINGGLSPQAILNAGPGNYIATVHKNGFGFEGYTYTIDCYDANGVRVTGNQATQVQNQ